MASRTAGLAITLASLLQVCHTAAAAAQTPGRSPIQLSSRPLVQLTLHEQLRLGSLSGPEDAFGTILGLQRDSRGRIFVVDGSLQQVLVFDSLGHRIGTMGRKGEGPGEFLSPWTIAVDRKDSAFVVDLALGRVSVFDPALGFVRSFPLIPTWGLATFLELPNRHFLVSGYARGQAGALHELARDGALIRTFPIGMAPDRDQTLFGYERSLLGGTAALGSQGMVFANKSPYTVAFLSPAGDVVRTCTGDPRWTSDPKSVVRVEGRTVSLDWNKYVHVAQVFALDRHHFLIATRDPIRKVTRLDVLTDTCEVLSRSDHPEIGGILALKDSVLLALGTHEYPEAIVFAVRLQRSER